MGDLPAEATLEGIRRRVWDTLHESRQINLFYDIKAIVLNQSWAASGASYAVVTAGQLEYAVVTPLTC